MENIFVLRVEDGRQAVRVNNRQISHGQFQQSSQIGTSSPQIACRYGIVHSRVRPFDLAEAPNPAGSIEPEQIDTRRTRHGLRITIFCSSPGGAALAMAAMPAAC